MTHREELMQNYEDAFFALMVDEMAEAEGAELLQENERLIADDSFQVPPALHDKCLKMIDRHFKAEKRRTTVHTLKIVLNRVAVAGLVTIMLFASAFAVYEPLRIATLKFMIEVFDDHSAFSLGTTDDGVAPEYRVESVTVGWVPEGFVQTVSFDDPFLYQYERDGEARITVQCNSAAVSISVDTEDSEVHSAEVQGQEALYYTKGNEVNLVCPIRGKNAMLIITSEGVSVDELLRVADELDIQ